LSNAIKDRGYELVIEEVTNIGTDFKAVLKLERHRTIDQVDLAIEYPGIAQRSVESGQSVVDRRVAFMAVINPRDQHVPAGTKFVRIGCRGRNCELGDAARGGAGKVSQDAAREVVEQRIKIGHCKCEYQPVGRVDATVEFEALDGLLASVLQRKAGAGEGKALEALDGLIEQRKVEAEAFPLAFDSDFIHRGIFWSGKA